MSLCEKGKLYFKLLRVESLWRLVSDNSLKDQVLLKLPFRRSCLDFFFVDWWSGSLERWCPSALSLQYQSSVRTSPQEVWVSSSKSEPFVFQLDSFIKIVMLFPRFVYINYFPVTSEKCWVEPTHTPKDSWNDGVALISVYLWRKCRFCRIS